MNPVPEVIPVEVQLLSGRLARQTPGSAGFDLFAAADAVLPVRGSAAVDTGVRTKFAPGLVGLIRDRSGLAFKHRVSVRGGVVDSDFDGLWRVMLMNESDAPYLVRAGDRIAQVLFLPLPVLTLAGDGWQVGDAVRGDGGFGSTGR